MAPHQGSGGEGRHLTDVELDSLRQGRPLGDEASGHLNACKVCQQIVESLRTFDPEEGVERMLARAPSWAKTRRLDWRFAVGGLAAAVILVVLGWSAALRVRAGEQALSLVEADAAAAESSVVGLRARNDAFLASMQDVHEQLVAARAGSAAQMSEAVDRALRTLDGALELSADVHQPVIKVSAAPGGQVRITTDKPVPTSQTLDTAKSGPFVASLVHDQKGAGMMRILSFAPEVGNSLLCDLVSKARDEQPGPLENLTMAFTTVPRNEVGVHGLSGPPGPPPPGSAAPETTP
jgi:hypothetical protein